MGKQGRNSAAVPTARTSRNIQTRRAAREKNTTNMKRGCAAKQTREACRNGIVRDLAPCGAGHYSGGASVFQEAETGKPPY